MSPPESETRAFESSADASDALLEELRRRSAPESDRLVDLDELGQIDRDGDPGRGAADAADAADAAHGRSAADTPRASAKEILDRVRLRVRVELGRRTMRVDEAVALEAGGVIDLGRGVDAPVDVFIGQLAIARGHVVVVDGRLAVRISEVLAQRSPDREESSS